MCSSLQRRIARHHGSPSRRPPRARLLGATAFLVFLLTTLALPAQDLRITEFLANNAGGLRDADGDSPDWLEIHNPTIDPVNLAGWHLTDASNDLTRWTFPATNLAAGAYLVVFASGKDRAVAGSELHTNFQLNTGGEFLALVRSDGASFAHAYSPSYPPQRANASYGIQQVSNETLLLATGAPARVLIPLTDQDLPINWMAREFSDDAWPAASTGMGFDASDGATNVTLRVDFNARASAETGAADTEPGWETMTLTENPKPIGSVTLALTPLGGATLEDRDRAVPVDNPPDLTQAQLYDDFIFALGSFNGAGLRLELDGLPPNQDYELTVWSYDGAGSGGIRVSDWIEVASAVTNVIIAPYQYDQSIQPTLDGHDTFGGSLRSSSTGRLRIEGRRSGGVNNGVYLNAIELVKPDYDSLIAFDLGPAMHGRNASAFIRIPITVANAAAISSLQLRMKYDDGFVAWLNGHLIAARNAPAQLDWNSTATAARSRNDAMVFEEIAIPSGRLVDGPNVLAIQGLNLNADDSDFLIVPELIVTSAVEAAGHYFSPPTPGAPNGPGFPAFVADTKFSADRGYYHQPFTVAITTATADAQIRWTTDGSAPTATTGAIYSDPILVDQTTFLRAAAFRSGWLPSDVDTHTYLFLDQVLEQSASRPGYPTVWQASYPADYGMDPNVVNSPAYGLGLKDDLRSIPALSIVTSHSNLWHSANGIYNNATSEGTQWERPASIELINPDGTTAFAVPCGFQMQGNASRDNVRTPKHALRLLFKSRYGVAKLNYDWFGGSVDEFNTIVLRACFTDSWPTRYSDPELVPGFPWRGQRYRPEDSLLLRDVWVKDSFRDMGWLSGRGAFVHLYLNGLYWGVYNPTERLDAEFLVSHLGGRPEDWDVIRDFTELLDGSMTDWNQMMGYVNAGITSEPAYQAIASMVDIRNLIDYMLLHFLAEAEDWPHHNWYAAHRRTTVNLPATKWIFLPWDQEIVLDQLVRRNRVNVSNDNTPARIYSQLRAWPEFRRLFGDRIQKHLFNGGALTPSRNIARLEERAAKIDRAIVGESARWGDAREFAISPNIGHGQTFTRDEWWLPELRKLATQFFPTLNEANLARFRAAGLYPTLAAPVFSQFGGAVPDGFRLTLTHANPDGTSYYTLDGSDPRQYSTGVIAPSAHAYSAPMLLSSPTIVRARVLNANQWSALVEATFYPPLDLAGLALTEIMYNPPSVGATNSGEFEFLELLNTGGHTLDLSHLTFTRGISFTFPLGSLLPPEGYAVLARNPAAFAMKYPGVPLTGLFTGRLADDGETLTLAHPSGATIFSVTYHDRAPWPVTADGFGFSLVPKQPGATPAPDDGAKWRASSQPGGSPGEQDPEPIIPAIVINEILSHTDLPQRDAVELHNPTGTDADIGGWCLTDEASSPGKFRIPPDTVLSAGGYAVLGEADFNPTPGVEGQFAFDSTGDSVYLFSANHMGELTGYNHGAAFGAAFNGISFGRHLNSVGGESFPPQKTVTLGSPNAGPRVGPLIINEIHYHPATGDDEFIELLNVTGDAVPLFHPGFPTNTWTLRGLAYSFPPGLTLGPHALVLLVATDPAVFRAKYAVPADVIVLGPFAGILQDSGERIELLAPDAPNPDRVPYVLIEAVRYNDKSPWPVAADGGGPSLQRKASTAYADDPASWRAISPTPGRLLYDAHTDTDGDGHSDADEAIAGTDPFDPRSVLSLQWTTVDPEGWFLFFTGVAGRSYTIESTPRTPTSTWETSATWPAASTNRTLAYPITNTIGPARFFRLRVDFP